MFDEIIPVAFLLREIRRFTNTMSMGYTLTWKEL